MEMRVSTGLTLAAAFGLVWVVGGCTAAEPASSAQSAVVERQARDALARWDAAAAAASGTSGVVLVGEHTLMIGDDWGPGIDGGNAKMAWGAGLFESAIVLPTATPPDARVSWQDGTTTAVPVISAAQAFDDLRAAATSACSDCTPLRVTAATLTTATFDTSRGKAEVPAWVFSLEGTDVTLAQAAVASQISPAPTANTEATPGDAGPWIGPAAMSATLDSGGATLTVTFTGAPDTGDKPCGADYTAQAFESDNAVVVVVFEHINTLPAMCSAVGAYRTAQVTLSRPLGSRTLIGLDAQPISVTPSP
jgi:hypothetical protein